MEPLGREIPGRSSRPDVPSAPLLSVSASRELDASLAHACWPLPVLRTRTRGADARDAGLARPLLPGRPPLQREACTCVQGLHERLDQAARAPLASARKRHDRGAAGGAGAAEPGDARALGRQDCALATGAAGPGAAAARRIPAAR